MRRLWPDPTDRPLGDDGLVAAYEIPDRSAPGLRVNMVTSLDGAAAVDGVSVGLSSTEDRRLLGLLRMLSDVLLVGAGTLRQENYMPLRLTRDAQAWRLDHDLPANPRLAVVSNLLDLRPELRALADAPVRPLVLTAGAASVEREEDLAQVAEVVRLGGGRVDVRAAVEALHRLGLHQVLCEGGPTLVGALTAADLVDELCLSVSPLLAGPGAGRITAGATVTTIPRRLVPRQVIAGDGGMLFLRYGRVEDPG